MGKRIFASAATTLAAIFVMTGSTFAASSQGDWNKWKGTIRQYIATKVDGIEKLVNYRDVACSARVGAQNIAACQAAYDVIIWRRKAEKVELDLMLAAAELDPVARDELLKVVPNKENAAFNNQTTARYTLVSKIFPMLQTGKVVVLPKKAELE